MKKYIFFCLLLSTVKISAQNINWKRANDWRLYNVRKNAALLYSLDSLQKYPFEKMDIDSVNMFLKTVELSPIEKRYVWMGAYYVSCSIDSVVHKVDISLQGEFLYDDVTKRYYILTIPEKEKWNEWLYNLRNRAIK